MGRSMQDMADEMGDHLEEYDNYDEEEDREPEYWEPQSLFLGRGM